MSVELYIQALHCRTARQNNGNMEQIRVHPPNEKSSSGVRAFPWRLIEWPLVLCDGQGCSDMQ
eukprot:206191-Amphidinium_carterae.1